MSDVLFRGPMMVFPQGAVPTMRIPDGMLKSPNMEHPDGYRVRQHYAGLFVATLPAPASPVPPTLPVASRKILRRAHVTISDNSGLNCQWDASLNAMVDLKERSATGATGPLVPVDDAHVLEYGAALVTFQGGTLSVAPGKVTNLRYTIPGYFSASGVDNSQQIPTLIRWTPNAGSPGVTIDITDATGPLPTIALAAGETACVYNWDGNPQSSKPTPKEFMDFRAAKCGATSTEVLDIDFKWLYDLCKPPLNDWTSWRNNKALPAPVSPCRPVAGALKPKTAPGKDCLGGRWGG